MKNITELYKVGSLLVVFLFSGLLIMAQDFPPWPVPDNANAIENPVASSKKSLESGKALFNLQCKACHGETGKGDGLIKSASLVSGAFTSQSDGAILWKIQEGRGQMPSFKALPEEQLWDLVNYIRSLSVKRDGIVMKNAEVSIFFNEKGIDKTLVAKVEQLADDGTKTPAVGIRVNVGIERYFGILPVSASSFTNEKGEVSLTFPNQLIGNEDGELAVVASIEDMEYNPAEAIETITWGEINPNDYWSERRALWKNNDYVPLWLLASFAGAAMAIWLVIGYVALLVRKIKIEGDKAF